MTTVCEGPCYTTVSGVLMVTVSKCQNILFSRPVRVRFVVDKVALGQFLFRLLRFSPML
jgi:hypothetical protein